MSSYAQSLWNKG